VARPHLNQRVRGQAALVESLDFDEEGDESDELDDFVVEESDLDSDLESDLESDLDDEPSEEPLAEEPAPARLSVR